MTLLDRDFAPLEIECERCGSEGRLYRADGRWPDGSERERDLGECPDCRGAGVVETPTAERDDEDEQAPEGERG